ncbi:transporter [Halomonas ramblicola]|uniref:transporter n=1 Tax=Halomonas ramblicola TaxID=747349 RepID=UPI0025B51C3E|nr:transporter [Halomonas ramblicola]MDN3523259.1 transporter [Halomonas ramblicola]
MAFTTKQVVSATGLVSLLGCSLAWAQPASQGQGTAPAQPVGQQPPEQELQPEVQAIADFGGVLTPRGRLVLEPEFQYSHESINRMTFEGVEVLSTLLIGVFTAQDLDRDSYTAALTGRLGVTDRLELEMKLPYVYRDETERVTVAEVDPSFDLDRELSGNSLGDIELAAHYQLNRGQGGMPFFIGNLRYKSTTGEGPFDIRRNSAGVPQELPTGTGFHSIEPSLTMLFPSAPAVYFANLGYAFNLEDDVGKRAGDISVGEVDPGDAVRLSFGMAYSINPRTSFTLGYKNDFIGETDTEYVDEDGNSVRQSSNTLNVGSMLLGWSYQFNQDVSVNLGLEFGITDDAPDTLLTLRMPFGMNVF